MYRFPNPDNNEWINKYNELVAKVESGEIVFEQNVVSEQNGEAGRIDKLVKGKTTLHHIIPRSISPELTKDKNNHIYVPFKEHMDLHYYLWKADKSYARQLWFGCVFGRKHGLWNLPNGDEEYEQLKKDLNYGRKVK